MVRVPLPCSRFDAISNLGGETKEIPKSNAGSIRSSIAPDVANPPQSQRDPAVAIYLTLTEYTVEFQGFNTKIKSWQTLRGL
jgi:hypothetical protein